MTATQTDDGIEAEFLGSDEALCEALRELAKEGSYSQKAICEHAATRIESLFWEGAALASLPDDDPAFD